MSNKIITTEMAHVMMAYADGKEIEYRNINSNNDEWQTTLDPLWDWRCYEYRIKPDVYKRAYKDMYEFEKAMMANGKYLVLDGPRMFPVYYDDDKVMFFDGDRYSYVDKFMVLTYHDLMCKGYVWVNGVHCYVEDLYENKKSLE